MSRAINLSLGEPDVTAHCDRLGIVISAIESLPKGGTHVVCRTSEGAELLRHKLKGHLITGKVLRFPFMRLASSW